MIYRKPYSFTCLFQSDPPWKGESYERRKPWHCFWPNPYEISRTRCNGCVEWYTVSETGGRAAYQKWRHFILNFQFEGKKKCFTDEGMFYSNLIGSYSWIISWLEVWAYNQIKMKELPVVFVAPLSFLVKQWTQRFLPVLVILGVYHVKRNSSYCMISPLFGKGTPYKGNNKTVPLRPGYLWL